MKRKPGLLFSLLLIPGASILIISCSGKQSNEAEKRIVGTWVQEGGTGVIANLDMKITYSFERENRFRTDTKVGDQLLNPTRTGSYEITADSIFFYYGGSDEPGYSAKLIFTSDTKIALLDSNGELDFSKK